MENYKAVIRSKESGSTKFLLSKGPSFLEVIIKKGTMKNLLRPKNLLEIKKKFMKKK